MRAHAPPRPHHLAAHTPPGPRFLATTQTWLAFSWCLESIFEFRLGCLAGKVAVTQATLWVVTWCWLVFELVFDSKVGRHTSTCPPVNSCSSRLQTSPDTAQCECQKFVQHRRPEGVPIVHGSLEIYFDADPG